MPGTYISHQRWLSPWKSSEGKHPPTEIQHPLLHTAIQCLSVQHLQEKETNRERPNRTQLCTSAYSQSALLSLCQTLATSQFRPSVLNTGTEHSLSWASKYFLWLLDQHGFEWCLSSSSETPTHSLCRENTATGTHFLPLPTLGNESYICSTCCAGMPGPFLPNLPAGQGCKLSLRHLSGYLKPLGSTCIRFFFSHFGGGWGSGGCGLEENWAVRNKLDHNQPYLCRDINKHIL